MAFAPGWPPPQMAYAQAGQRPSWVALSQVALVAVADACAIASSACHVARSGTASVLVSLAGTGRSNVFIGEDVEAELPEALQKVAADMGVPLADAERALRQIMTRIRVVPLRMGDYLNPWIAGIRRCDPDLPRAARGDPDDLGTAAVAAFLAPAIIISKVPGVWRRGVPAKLGWGVAASGHGPALLATGVLPVRRAGAVTGSRVAGGGSAVQLVRQFLV